MYIQSEKTRREVYLEAGAKALMLTTGTEPALTRHDACSITEIL
jgi:hypothetical protein